jgi:hypothetical protein
MEIGTRVTIHCPDSYPIGTEATVVGFKVNTFGRPLVIVQLPSVDPDRTTPRTTCFYPSELHIKK